MKNEQVISSRGITLPEGLANEIKIANVVPLFSRVLFSVVKRGPNPRISPSPPRFLGTGRGWGQVIRNFWGYFGDGDDFNFGVYWGFIPKNPQKGIGEILGTELTQSLGIFGDFSPKKTQIFGIPQKSPIW